MVSFVLDDLRCLLFREFLLADCDHPFDCFLEFTIVLRVRRYALCV